MIKIAIVIILDFLLTYSILGVAAAAVLTACILFYLWIGESIDLWRHRAVSIDKLDRYTRTRLESLQRYIVEDVRRVYGRDISSMKLHVTPGGIPNAYTYGYQNISLTKYLLDNCDDATVCAVLGHEASHMLHLDAVFNRVVFANVTAVIIGLSLGSLISVSFLWILFFILVLCGICGGFLSFMLFRGIGRMVRGIYTALQYAVLFIYQAAMGICSRQSEFQADRFSCELGYGPQLQYFLTRFQDMQRDERNLLEILYASHPPVYERVRRIEQHEEAVSNG
ncbi:MAG: M48 family metalloprotease [Eubacteriales bacterium]|nr:M48 family metalloprotease [Eubacteriales bacterium]